jgi:Ca2+-binding RTX toxin-like protein
MHSVVPQNGANSHEYTAAATLGDLMTTTIRGYFETDLFTTTGGGAATVGDELRLNSTWSAATDYFELSITDDDTLFDGDTASDEIGADSTQSATASTSTGALIDSGQIYLDYEIVVSDGEGNLTSLYVVDIGGNQIGVIASPELVPGATYEVVAINDDFSAPDYSAFALPTYDDPLGQTYDGGAFDDTFIMGGGNDTGQGGAGNDYIDGGAGDDFLSGNDGDDTLHGEYGDDTLAGGAGNDTIWGGAGIDNITGGDGDDIISGTNGSNAANDGGDTIDGGAGNDTISGGAGDDTITGGEGADIIDGGTGDDYILFGTGGATQADGDIVYGGDGNDIIDDAPSVQYGAYDDALYGEAGNDIIFAGGGDDILDGGSDDDTLYGESGNDTMYGGTGNDILYGGAGDDLIDGGAGNDLIESGSGSDTITTGTGNDFVSLSTGGGADTITDFDMTLDGAGFTVDQLISNDLVDGNGDPINAWDVVVTDDGSGNALLTFPSGDSVVLQGVSPTQVDTPAELYSIGIPCFVSGTRIMTPSGARAVESLQAGDMITTLDHGQQPLLWHGTKHIDRTLLDASPELRPILIRDGTLGNDGDLLVSPQHAMVVPDPRRDGGACRVFARATHLLKYGDGRVRAAKGLRTVTYHHLLLPMHSIVLANGALTESLYPGSFALSGFDRAAKAELFGLFPALETVLCAPTSDITVRLYGKTALGFAKPRDMRHAQVSVLPARGARPLREVWQANTRW